MEGLFISVSPLTSVPEFANRQQWICQIWYFIELYLWTWIFRWFGIFNPSLSLTSSMQVTCYGNLSPQSDNGELFSTRWGGWCLQTISLITKHSICTVPGFLTDICAPLAAPWESPNKSLCSQCSCTHMSSSQRRLPAREKFLVWKWQRNLTFFFFLRFGAVSALRIGLSEFPGGRCLMRSNTLWLWQYGSSHVKSFLIQFPATHSL